MGEITQFVESQLKSQQETNMIALKWVELPEGWMQLATGDIS